MELAKISIHQFSPEVLGQVMARLSNPAADFTLHVSDGFSERVAYFCDRTVRVLSVGERLNSGPTRYLFQRGLVDAERLKALLAEVKKTGRPLRDELIERGDVTEADYADILRRLVLDDLQDLVFWDDAYSNVYQGSPPAEVFEEGRRAIAVELDWRELSEDVAEWAHKWPHFKTLLHSDRAKILVTEAGAVASTNLSDPTSQTCLEACRQEPSLRELWQFTGLELPRLCERMVEFVKSGWARIQAPPSRETPEELERSVNRLEENLKKVIDKDLLHEKLSRLYIRTGLVAKAVRELKLLAESASAKGDWELRLSRLKALLVIEPQNIDVFREAIHACVEHNREKEAVDLAVEQGALLLKRHAPVEALAVATELKLVRGGRFHAMRLEADALVASGQLRAAVPKYVTLARDLEEKQDYAAAIELLARVVSYGASDAALENKIKELEAKTAPQARPSRVAKSKSAPSTNRDKAAGALPAPVNRSKWKSLLRQAAVQGAALALVLTMLVVFGIVSFNDRDAQADIEGFDPGSGQGGASSASPGNGMALLVATGLADDFTCEHVVTAKHSFVRRPLDGARIVSFAHSCGIRLLDARTGASLAQADGRTGARWAIGFRGERFCLWQPGERPIVFNASLGPGQPLSWSIPANAEAVAVGTDRIAVRRGRYTTLFRDDGSPVKGNPLPVWSDGAFASDLLILTHPAEGPAAPARFWGVRVRNLDVAWSGTVIDGLALLE